MSVTLILFCKKPAPGIGKQRLAETLGTNAALRIASLLHDCALEQLRLWRGPKVLATAVAADVDGYRQCYPDIDRVLAQPAGSLGERINHIDRIMRSEGHERQIIIGSDTPEQTPARLEEAASGLERHDIFLAPATDGGVSLMATRRGWPDLGPLPWSTGELGEALARSCADSGLDVGWGHACPDVDLPSDLVRLKRSLAADRRPAQRALHALLQELI
ncbi:MAG: DUF2064 domain-containing protein [Oceanospirillaceae bacterium]|nr:DUF2064 domain-containing protein [Oceanospirillaceae bacterium]